MNVNMLPFYILQAVINLFVCTVLVTKSFENKFRYSKRVTNIIATGYIIISVTIIELFFEKISPFAEYHSIAALIFALISILTAVITLRSNLLQLLFFVFAIMDIQMNITLISRSIYSLKLFPAGELNYLIISIVVLLLTIPAMWYLFAHLFKKVIEMEISAVYWKHLFILPFTYFMFYWFSMNSSSSITKNTWSNLGVLIFLNIGVFLSYIAVLQMLVRTHDSLKAIEKANLSEQIIIMQKAQYKQITNNIEKTNRLRHDFRHHLIAIRGFAENRDLDGLQKYLDSYQKESLPEDNTPVCNNYFVDIVLRHYIARAKSQGIDVNISAKFLADFDLPDTELCVVFGNLFENALESCERQKNKNKFIRIKTKNISKSMLAITVTNSYDGEIIKDGKEFVSNKHENVGIGISTIRSIAEKNGGKCKFDFENGIFKAYVLLVS